MLFTRDERITARAGAPAPQAQASGNQGRLVGDLQSRNVPPSRNFAAVIKPAHATIIGDRRRAFGFFFFFFSSVSFPFFFPFFFLSLYSSSLRGASSRDGKDRPFPRKEVTAYASDHRAVWDGGDFRRRR